MPLPPRLALVLVAAVAALWLLPRDRHPGAGAVLHAAAFDPYDTALLRPYGELRDALLEGDAALLWTIAKGDDYRALRAAQALAGDYRLSADERIAAFDRVLELRVDDPLALDETRALHLEVGRLAETAGRTDRAVTAYRAALPLEAAADGLRRVEGDPYRRSNAFLQARMHREALDALEGRAAPSIEAPSHYALREYDEAADAYRRWLAEQPTSVEAKLGLAWSRFQLGHLAVADALFSEVGGAEALYGRALIARRNGDHATALRLMRGTGDPRRMWLASDWLEQLGRANDAMELYLDIARNYAGSTYADDAAYRAYVLALRAGDELTAASARELIPDDSFFARRVGQRIRVPATSDVEDVVPDPIPLAHALAAVHDVDAAVGELLFALRDARSASETVALAEALQALGEFRQSQRAAAGLVSRGTWDARVWRLAWPEAYPEIVRPEAARHGLEPELIWAVMRQESAFYPRARSRSNAQGLMQVIPSTWGWLAELQGESPGDPYEPADNVRYGAYYLRYLLDYFDGDMELAVSSYNRGQGYIRRLFEGPDVGLDKDELYRSIDALETREYLQHVVVNYEIYKALNQAGHGATAR